MAPLHLPLMVGKCTEHRALVLWEMGAQVAPVSILCEYQALLCCLSETTVSGNLECVLAPSGFLSFPMHWFWCIRSIQEPQLWF